MTLSNKKASPGEAGLNDTTKNSPRHYNKNFIDSNVIFEQFRQAMQSAGIAYFGDIVADGQLHRFHIEGHKRGRQNGAYRLYLDNVPAGWFKDHKSKIFRTWRLGGGNGRLSLDAYEQIEAAKREREIEQRQRHKDAAIRANCLWRKASPVAEHPYLAKKKIQPHSAKVLNDALIIPLINRDKQIVNIQFISEKGEKRFLSGGMKRGCFLAIGEPTPRILIAEGFATASSLFEYSGHCTIIAFDAGNLQPVAKVIRSMFPGAEIILCADNDLSGVGQEKAHEAALAVKGKVLIPKIPGADWNDVITGGAL